MGICGWIVYYSIKFYSCYYEIFPLEINLNVIYKLSAIVVQQVGVVKKLFAIVVYNDILVIFVIQNFNQQKYL